MYFSSPTIEAEFHTSCEGANLNAKPIEASGQVDKNSSIPTFRILSLTGGGLLGVISAAKLERYETLGRATYGDAYKLSDSFDFAGGTSTGAVLATAVALGMPASSMVDFYLKDCLDGIAKRTFFVPGITPIYRGEKMLNHFRNATQSRKMQPADLCTDLGIVVKSLTSGEPILSTSVAVPDNMDNRILCARTSNAPLCLSRLLMASTAVTGLFAPQTLAIGPKCETETCVDGGLSAYNDPAHLLFSFIRRLQQVNQCPGAVERIELVSMGTGTNPATYSNRRLGKMAHLGLTLKAMNSIVVDNVLHTKATMRDLAKQRETNLQYTEHDMSLTEETFQLLGVAVDKPLLRRMRGFLSVEGKRELYEAARLVAERRITHALSLVKPRDVRAAKTVS